MANRLGIPSVRPPAVSEREWQQIVAAAERRAAAMTPEVLARRKPGLPSDYAPILPLGWRVIDRAEDGAAWRNPGMALMVVVSASTEQDGKRWLHVSFSHRDKLPSYDTMVTVKELFIGTDKTAYQVFPPRAKHVNIHEFTLHLWHCLDGDVTPDFTEGAGTI